MNTSVAKRLAVLLSLVVLAPVPDVAADSLTPGPAAALVPSTLIEVPETVRDVLIANAASAELVRFSRTGGGLTEADRRYMSVGRNGVGKQRAWDRKTPLGVYFLTEELDTTKLAAKYGEAAFVLDYPNAWDRLNERTGDGIWLHGVDPRTPDRPRRDTDGCLALRNEALLSLAEELVLHDTPVIVTREIQWVNPERVAAIRAALRGELERWRQSQESGDLHAYLSLYAEDFAARGMSKDQWAAFKLGAFAARDVQAIELGHVMLLRDPEAKDLYLSRFVLTTVVNNRSVTLRKRLYWRNRGNTWRIVAEDAG